MKLAVYKNKRDKYYSLWKKYEILDEKSTDTRKFHAEFLVHKAAYQKLYRKNKTKISKVQKITGIFTNQRWFLNLINHHQVYLLC